MAQKAVTVASIFCMIRSATGLQRLSLRLNRGLPLGVPNRSSGVLK